MARIAPGQAVEALVARGVPQHVAQGVVMNFMDESGLDTGIQEINPRAGRGGYGLAQWTGPRRVALEEFAASQGKPINDLDTQLDFFMQENAGPEAAAWKRVMAAPDANEAAVAFVNAWERPASEYAAQRTAKYRGADAPKVTSPYGIQAQHPPNPTVGTGGVTTPGANTTPVTPPAADKDKTDWGKAIGSAFGGIGGAMGGGGSMELRRGSIAPTPPMPAAPMPFVSDTMIDEQRRNQLAALMQQYWVT